MAKVTVCGAILEVPDGWSVAVGADGVVMLTPPHRWEHEESIHSGGRVSQASLTTFWERTTESAYKIVMQYGPQHGSQHGSDRTVERGHQQVSIPQRVQLGLPLVVRPVYMMPELRFARRADAVRLSPVWEGIWEVLRQGGWYTTGAVASRMGVPEPGGVKRSHLPEYSQVASLLVRAAGQGLIAYRIPERAKRHYAAREWVAEHPQIEEVVRR